MINNDTNARLLQNHVRKVRWVCAPRGAFALLICLANFYKRYIIANAGVNARLLQNHVRCVRWVLFQTGVSLFFIYLITLISLYRLLDTRFARFCDAILRKTRSFACLSFGRNTRVMRLAFTHVALFDKNFL